MIQGYHETMPLALRQGIKQQPVATASRNTASSQLLTPSPMRLLLILSLVLVGCTESSLPAESPAEPEVVVEVQVQRNGNEWSVEYILDRDAPVWFFPRSALSRIDRLPWRPTQWTVLTPGVILERRGEYDVLRANDGSAVPHYITLSLTPRSVSLMADYDPALTFADGSVALYTEHFEVRPIDSLEAVEALPHGLNRVPLPEAAPVQITWRDSAGPVLFQGTRHAEAVTRQGNTYVLFGQAGLREHADLATVVDPTMPAWINAEITAFSPRVIDRYVS